MKVLVVFTMTVLELGCAARRLPPTFPVSAAASPAAAAAPVAPVTVSLQGDPPLPGESNAGWPGLTPSPSSKEAGPPPPGTHHEH